MTRTFPPFAGAVLCAVFATYSIAALTHGRTRRLLRDADRSDRVYAREFSDRAGDRDSKPDDAALSVGPATQQVEAAAGLGATEKTLSSSPQQGLGVERPAVFLATARRSSDVVPLILTNSVDSIFTYRATIEDAQAGFSVSGCKDGFVRARSHCVLSIAYRPTVAGVSTTKLTLLFHEVTGDDTETLVIPLSGFATAGENSSVGSVGSVRHKSGRSTHPDASDTDRTKR